MAVKQTTKLVEEIEEFDLEKKVTVKSIADWQTGFKRIDGVGEVNIAPSGSVRLSRNEIISQVQSGNKLFAGIDGRGSHATLIIDDLVTRKELGFESDNINQCVFSEQKVKDLFLIANESEFENKLKEEIVTRAEQYAIVAAIRNLKLNDYSKIVIVERYTGFKIRK